MKKEPTINLACSFCGKTQREVRKLIAGPTVYICDECIKRCNEIIAEETRRPGPTAHKEPAPARKATRANQRLCCSFCGKSQREVSKLIAGPTVYICDECIGLCNDIITEELELESVAVRLNSLLPGDARAFLATILERGSGAAERLSNIAYKRYRRSHFADRVRKVLYRFRRRIPVQGLGWVSLLSLTSEWRTLQTIVGERESLEAASSPSTEAELPAWVRPVAERLTSTVELLEALSPRLEQGRLEESRDSLELANAQLRRARDLLMTGPPKPPAAS